MRARLVRPSSVVVLVGLAAALLVGFLQQRAGAEQFVVNVEYDAVAPIPDTMCDADLEAPGLQ